jgi:branched-chain amino acid transport system ATP-binding protein
MKLPFASGRTAAPATYDPAQAVQCSGLTVRYRTGALGLTGLTVDIPRAKVTAIGGRNGSGKTTLLRAIAGFMPGERVSVQGHIVVNGVPVTCARPAETVKHGIAFVPDTRKVFRTMTVREHLALATRRTGLAVDEVLAEYPQLSARVDQTAQRLSGGERQMLAIAMAIARGPSVLLVDETVLGLAPMMRKVVLERLRATSEDAGRTVVIVGEEREILDNGDHVILLEHGALRGVS